MSRSYQKLPRRVKSDRLLGGAKPEASHQMLRSWVTRKVPVLVLVCATSSIGPGVRANGPTKVVGGSKEVLAGGERRGGLSGVGMGRDIGPSVKVLAIHRPVSRRRVVCQVDYQPHRHRTLAGGRLANGAQPAVRHACEA